MSDFPPTQTPPANSRIYYIRHGETEWSRSGHHTGRTDIPLTPQGETDARQLAEPLATVKFSAVLTSPRRRARQTCELAGLGGVAKIEPDLAEWDYGDYEGKLSVDIRQGRPDWNIYRDGCPHGESPAQISARADRLIARLRELTGNIALFSHGHFGRVLATRWIGLPIQEAQHLSINPASVGIFSYEQNLVSVPAILLWNAIPQQLI